MRVALIALIAIGLVSHALIRMYASELVIFARARPPLATASAAPPLLRGGYGDTTGGGGDGGGGGSGAIGEACEASAAKRDRRGQERCD